MAYVRQRGNQVAIVHGVRDPETRKVEQQILFTLYSKGEALEALGRREGARPERFQMLLEQQYPEIRFDWAKIRRGIEEKMGHLPDLYEYRTTRLLGRFRQDLCAFARQLILADPQELHSASQVIQEQRLELEFLAELIQWRVQLCEQEASEWNADNPFYWRFALRGSEVPPEIEEQAADLYHQGEYQRAAAVFGLLIECFDRYAEGYNYLGLIALEQELLEEAIGHFEKTVEVGRRLFPKRIAKSRYWSDHSTRPYMRGLQNLALTLNQTGSYEEALAICDRLERECDDDINAASTRASVFLNTGRWQEAAEAALHLHRIGPAESLVAAMAFFELGETHRAVELFVHGALNHPRTARMLAGERMGRPKASEEIRDHNTGVALKRALDHYLNSSSATSRGFFQHLVRHPQVVALLEEIEALVQRWHHQRSTPKREAFERMTVMHSLEFARAEAERIVSTLLRASAGTIRP
ncbi:MAG: hypothetical protein GY719_31050 [bacterium]|nr:hypothetical protein [bacterium]